MGRHKKIRYVRRNRRIPKKTKAVRKELHKARYKANLTMEQVAAKLRIHTAVYCMYEHGVSTPPLKTAAKLARILKTPVESLFPDIFYHFDTKWDDYYRFNGYSEREIILAHQKHAKYRLFHPRKRPRSAKKDWNQWFD